MSTVAATDYAVYIWWSYGLAGVVLLWLLFSAKMALTQSETRLKQLQISLEPASEGAADNAVTNH